MADIDLLRQLTGANTPPATLGSLGRSLLAKGRPLEAIPLLWQAIRDSAEINLSLYPLLSALLDTGQAGQALWLLRSPPKEQQWEMRFHFLQEAVLAKRFDLVETMLKHSSDATIERMIDEFWLALVRYRTGRHDEAVRLFRRAGALSRCAWAEGFHLWFIPAFTAVGETLLDGQELAELEAEADTGSEPLEWIRRPEPDPLKSGPVVVMGCDEKYFIRFADDSLRGVIDGGVFDRCHIHVAGCGDECRLLMETLRDRHSEISLDFSTGPRPSENVLVHYASCRFFIAEYLMRFYDSDLVIVDIDSKMNGNMPALLELMKGNDIGAFCDKTTLPWLSVLAGVVCLNNNERTHRYLRILSRALRNRIQAAPLWMVDQSALYCVMSYLQSTDSLRVASFGEETGHKLEWALEPLIDGEGKKELRRNAR